MFLTNILDFALMIMCLRFLSQLNYNAGFTEILSQYEVSGNVACIKRHVD
ncbi:hypothetical protein SAMN05443144_12927 [Fodinibius roseus]|uniref:Uncharacterized protein n=1 Tax=Fodinibius roseus TaxID=1194090 RepID=A0A1M5K2J9_9BACT|nr:hypothetical protein SAMN05443144_12927 [Fodinibius roseus]